MRPERLELQGFTAFRDPTVVDFAEADLFALTGPTGSGKSSLIDALTFALYGAVPRYDDKRAVEPVITLGAVEARVRFDFTVAGRRYTAVRVVRRTRAGATTAEARLEGGREVVGGADEVTAAVERLLGLSFDHFTKCVVLPQGEFAAFLHDKPAKRQELLRRLLELDVYERMRELAARRRAADEEAARVLAAQLAELADATIEAEAEAVARVDRLTGLREWLDGRLPGLEALAARAAELRGAAAEAARREALLSAVKVPAEVAGLTRAHGEAREASSAAEEQVAAAEAAAAEAEARLGALPAADALDRTIELHRRMVGEQAAREKGRPVVAEAEGRAASAAAGEERAAAAAAGAVAALAEAERSHQAHVLAGTLREGAPCPVCGQAVGRVPKRRSPPGLDAARAALAEADSALSAARAARAEAERHLTVCTTRMSEIEARLAAITADLAGRPTLEEATVARAAVASAVEQAAATREAVAASRREADRRRKAAEAAAAALDRARRGFDAARDGVAALGPPAAGRADLATDWRELAEWAEEASAASRRAAAQAEAEAAAAGEQAAAGRRAVDDRLRGEGVEPAPDPRAAVAAASAAASLRLEQVRERIARRAGLTEEEAGRRQAAAVAKELGRHLSATGFEAWLMEEALAALVAGANLLLADLSQGAYSLEPAKRDFVVVDHRNADECRPVKTLSGGETFLVSLALALSLSEQLAAMSAHGATRLESIFLDEGFGTLDAETLDTVAAVIHELGARGRTVGLVTHVAELAEQVPVRFEVRKGPRTATVTRVEAGMEGA
jgi:exonuclease SbcC